MKQKTWNYKGLNCILTELESGTVFSVFDISAITKQPMQILYQGRKKGFTQKEVEQEIDNYLKEKQIKPFTTCKNFIKAIQNNCCPFKEVCPEDCWFTYYSADTVEELESKIDDLEDELAENRSTIEELEDELEEIREDG